MTKIFENPTMTRLQTAAKLLFLSISLFVAFGGHYPPAYSQETHVRLAAREVLPVVTVEDAVQDNKIGQIDKHLEATDAQLQRAIEAVNRNAQDISGIQGEERIIGGVLTLLSSAGLFLQIRRKSA